MSELIINKCYIVDFDRGSLQNPVIIKINRIYKNKPPKPSCVDKLTNSL